MNFRWLWIKYRERRRAWTVVFMPAAITSTACGLKGKSTRKLVIVTPPANLSLARITLHSSMLLGMPFSCGSTGISHALVAMMCTRYEDRDNFTHVHLYR